ncbi:hypothetical protein ILYODFUR_009091 [Ilyodon furcidens]|uniref:Uncharacterized protein n=1 Tax=Ilyodon furcidens TaxID=33524 RepID=A0ABV0V1K9_9TELE
MFVQIVQYCLCTQYLVGDPFAGFPCMKEKESNLWLHISSMGFRSDLFACQSDAVISWSLKQVLVLLEDKISISIQLVNRVKHKVLKNFLLDSCADFGLYKTHWTNTSRWNGSTNYH